MSHCLGLCVSYVRIPHTNVTNHSGSFEQTREKNPDTPGKVPTPRRTRQNRTVAYKRTLRDLNCCCSIAAER